MKDIGIRKGPRVKISARSSFQSLTRLQTLPSCFLMSGVSAVHYIKEDRERLAVLASPSYSAAMTPPGSPARFVSPPSPPSPTFNLDFNFGSSLVVTELRLEPDLGLGCDEEDAGRAPFSPWVESADSESVTGPVASPQPLPQEDDDRATSPTATGAHCGECAGLLVLYHTNNNRLSSSGRPLSAFGKIMVTDVSEMTKNRQDPEEPTRGEEWLCACCGALNPVDGPDVCAACGDVTGKTKGVVLYAGELQKAADRDTSGSIFQKILTHGLSARSKPVAIRFDAEPIYLKQKLKQQGKSAQVKAVNISLAEAPRAKLARHKSTHQAAVHISRVIPIRSKPVSAILPFVI